MHLSFRPVQTHDLIFRDSSRTPADLRTCLFRAHLVTSDAAVGSLSPRTVRGSSAEGPSVSRRVPMDPRMECGMGGGATSIANLLRTTYKLRAPWYILLTCMYWCLSLPGVERTVFMSFFCFFFEVPSFARDLTHEHYLDCATSWTIEELLLSSTRM